MLELERLNKDLNNYLIGVQQFCSDVSSVRVWERCACVRRVPVRDCV